MSIQAIEPPPAPMVVRSIVGVATGSPNSISKLVEWEILPSRTSPTSQEVPPMSSVTRLPAARELPEVLPGDDAAGQPGEEELDRLGLGGVGRGLAPVRLHQRPGGVESGLGEGGEGVLDVALHDRFHVAVGDGGAATLVLPPDRRDLMRERDRNVGEALRPGTRAAAARAPD